MKTMMALEIGPRKAVVSTSALILPVPPGGMVLSKLATVQPHVGRTWVISRGAWPRLRTSNTAFNFSPLATGPKSMIFWTKSADGCGPSGGFSLVCCATPHTDRSENATSRTMVRLIRHPPLRSRRGC